jgi:hypothetical protein
MSAFDFYLVVASVIPEQDHGMTLAQAVEQCWNTEEGDMDVYHVEPTKGRVTPVTEDVAHMMAQTVVENRIAVDGWLAEFLGRFDLDADLDDEVRPFRRSEHSTLNHAQQGLGR